MSKSHSRYTLIMAALLLSACVGDEEIIEVLEEVGAVNVAPAGRTIVVGQTQQFSAAVIGENTRQLQGRSVSWETGDPSVATVSPTGLATGVGPGTATITATSEGVDGSVTLVVQAPQAPPTVETLPADQVTSSGGRARATVNPNGAETTATFEFGLTPSLGQTCGAPVEFPPVNEDRPFNCTFSSVNPETTIFYRVTATNSGGTETGATLSFTTLPAGGSVDGARAITATPRKP